MLATQVGIVGSAGDNGDIPKFPNFPILPIIPIFPNAKQARYHLAITHNTHNTPVMMLWRYDVMNVIAKQARQSLATSPSFFKGRGLGWNVNIKMNVITSHNIS